MGFKHTEQVRTAAVIQLGEIGKAIALRPGNGEPCSMLIIVLDELRDIIHAHEPNTAKPTSATRPEAAEGCQVRSRSHKRQVRMPTVLWGRPFGADLILHMWRKEG